MFELNTEATTMLRDFCKETVEVPSTRTKCAFATLHVHGEGIFTHMRMLVFTRARRVLRFGSDLTPPC